MLRYATLLILALGLHLQLAAQTTLQRGTVRFYLEGAAADKGEKTAVYTVYFKPDTATAVLGLVSGEEALTIIYDFPTRIAYNVFKEAGRASVIPISLEEISASSEELDYKVTMLDVTRDILGYTCKPVRIQPADPTAGGLRISAWVTTEIDSPFKVLAGMEKYFPGFPLECSVKQAEGTEEVVYRAFAVEKNAPEALFVIPR